MEAFGIQITTEDADTGAKKMHLKSSSTRGDSMDDDLQSTTADVSLDFDQQSNMGGGAASTTTQSQPQVQFNQNRATGGPQPPTATTPLLSPTFTGRTTGA
uniref:Uncharacterized protein n=1 Tax=Romanomermis culicivorax TaxID=13658 RepID=A0A915IJP1_ROMCU